MGSIGSIIKAKIDTKCLKSVKWYILVKKIDHLYILVSLELNVIETHWFFFCRKSWSIVMTHTIGTQLDWKSKKRGSSLQNVPTMPNYGSTHPLTQLVIEVNRWCLVEGWERSYSKNKIWVSSVLGEAMVEVLDGTNSRIWGSCWYMHVLKEWESTTQAADYNPSP